MSPDPLADILALCRKNATAPDGAWEREQAQVRFAEVSEQTEASIPQESHHASRLGPKTTLLDTPALAHTRAAYGSLRLVWVGPPGAGKTTLAVAAMRAWVRQAGRAGFFVPAEKLGTAREHSRLGREADLVERALTAPLVLIDDLGAERESPSSAVGDVLRDRFAHHRATWITTGLDGESVKKRYDGGLVRRIFEGAVVIRVEPLPERA